MTRSAADPKRRKHGARRRRKKGRSPPAPRLGRVFVLLAAVVASGIQVVFTAHQLREVHGMLEATREWQDLLLAEHSRLLLERGALAAYHHVEKVAGAELNMQFPNEVERILP